MINAGNGLNGRSFRIEAESDCQRESVIRMMCSSHRRGIVVVGHAVPPHSDGSQLVSTSGFDTTSSYTSV